MGGASDRSVVDRGVQCWRAGGVGHSRADGRRVAGSRVRAGVGRERESAAAVGSCGSSQRATPPQSATIRPAVSNCSRGSGVPPSPTRTRIAASMRRRARGRSGRRRARSATERPRGPRGRIRRHWRGPAHRPAPRGRALRTRRSSLPPRPGPRPASRSATPRSGRGAGARRAVAHCDPQQVAGEDGADSAGGERRPGRRSGRPRRA